MNRPPVYLLTAILVLLASVLTAQDPSLKYTDLGSIRMSADISSLVSTAYIGKDDDPVKVFTSTTFTGGTIHTRPVPKELVMKKALVRFGLRNSADTAAGIYFFPGFYFRSIRLYRVEGNSLHELPALLPEIPEKNGYRYIRLNAGDSGIVLAELVFVKTYVNKLRPRLIQPDYLPAFIASIQHAHDESDLTTYIFCGLLLMMILYSLANYFQGANRDFLYYSGYAFLLGLMLFTKALFSYHTTPLNYFLEEYLDFILQCLGIIFYMIFMQRFLDTKKQYPFLHRLYNAGIVMLSVSLLAYTWLHYATDNFPLENNIENTTKLLLILMITVFLIYSARHWKDKLLRYLFWGNFFFLFFSLISMALILAPGILPASGLAGNSLLYYEMGLFFELVFFLAGLNFKNRSRIIAETKEREMLKAQNLLQEYEKEMAVFKAQREERERISADMHDELGSGITAIRLMSEIARNKMKESTPAEIEKISDSADDVLNKMNAIIWSMNSSNDTLDNLVLYIRTYAHEFFENTNVHCQVTTPEKIPAHELTGEKRRNVFLSVKETLTNILKHAQASLVTIDVEVNHALKIFITDNGKGVDLENLRRFGNGLTNITRRMESIGGTFVIENKNGTLTRLELPL